MIFRIEILKMLLSTNRTCKSAVGVTMACAVILGTSVPARLLGQNQWTTNGSTINTPYNVEVDASSLTLLLNNVQYGGLR
jgi:hypothetical protein